MRSKQEIILEVMNSMLASAQIEAAPGVPLQKFLLELEFLMEYPKLGESGKFTPGQVRYIKSVLDRHFKVENIDNIPYYIGVGLLF
jgi:hypothetical protein